MSESRPARRIGEATVRAGRQPAGARYGDPVIFEHTDRYLRAVDAALPGFVEMLYIVGSAALGAWQPGHSDVDLVIVTSRPATADDLTALAGVHAALPGPPYTDGVYLDATTFAAQPDDGRPVPFVVNGEFRTDRPCGELNPVLWTVLRRHGIPVRGPAVADLGLVAAPAALRRYNLENLRDYWRPLAGRVRQETVGHDGAEPVPGEPVAWLVLGPARLHHTLAHGTVVAKADAGAYLGRLFPAWQALQERAVRWRGGADETFTVGDLRAAADSVEAVVDDAWSRWGAGVPGR
ncbi:nucleotidyltransferase domain-containing protein [Polymorphospora rubra]|uniref:Polymerase nucleotidyl transferase domain-containing protein n=1 Tax=Polymorphospora rubra TaxID=338584 RepID=A0A810N6Q8_9ACTN|nr:nucleotidyltransferase domain-containing protein [Polymorphospora rubra]BCJ67458.1 hypothetical protein Prubr_44790 [Polymorphospora rubra]